MKNHRPVRGGGFFAQWLEAIEVLGRIEQLRALAGAAVEDGVEEAQHLLVGEGIPFK